MKNQSWLKYFLYILVMIGLIYLDGYVLKQQTIYQQNYFKASLVYLVLSHIIKVTIGLFLGLEYIIKETEKGGKWKINLPKFILMGIPSLFFSISLFLGSSSNEFLQTLFAKSAYLFMINNTGFIYIFQILFGYFLITSFYKQNPGIKEEVTV